MELEACSRLDMGRLVWLCSDLACTSYHFALILSIDLEQTRDLVWPAMDFPYCKIGKILILHMGSGFSFWDVLATKLTSIFTIIPYAICLGTIRIILNWFEGLVNENAKYDLGMSGLCIRVIINVWTQTKWNWLVHFVPNLCQLFLAMSLIRRKNN